MDSHPILEAPESKKGNLKQTDRFLIFRVYKQSFAVAVSSVNRVIRSVNITPVPGSPSSVKGVINLYGETVPVVDFRRKFGLPRKKIELKDKIVILDTSTVRIGFVADDLVDITDLTEQQESPVEKIIPGMEKEVSGLLLFNGQIVLIYDVEKIFLEDAEKTVDLLQRKKKQKKTKA